MVQNERPADIFFLPVFFALFSLLYTLEVTGHPPAGSSIFFALLFEIIVVLRINFFKGQPAGGWGVTNYL